MPKKNDEINYTNNVDRAYMEGKIRKSRFKRRINLISWSLRIFFVIMLAAYLMSDYSKVLNVAIYGNKALSYEEIKTLSTIDTSTFYYLFSPKLVQNKIKKNPLVKNVTVKRKSHNLVRIDIEEYEIVASLIKDDILSYVLENGELIAVDKTNIDYIVEVPYIVNLEDKDEHLKALVDNLKDLNPSTLALISEIVYFPLSYDDMQLKLHMIDHNTVYVSILNLKSVNQYNKIAMVIEQGGVCIYFDSLNTQPYMGSCIENGGNASDENNQENPSN